MLDGLADFVALSWPLSDSGKVSGINTVVIPAPRPCCRRRPCRGRGGCGGGGRGRRPGRGRPRCRFSQMPARSRSGESEIK